MDMPDKHKKRVYGIRCNCGNNTNFNASWYSEMFIRLEAVLIQYKSKLYIVKPSLVKYTESVGASVLVKNHITIEKCGACGHHVPSKYYKVPYPLLVGYWKEDEKLDNSK